MTADSSRGRFEPPQWKSAAQVSVHAVVGGIRSFVLAFALRGGISFAIRLVRVLRGRESLHDALRSFFGPESHRFARTVGSFSFLWKLINNMLLHRRRQIAGTGDSVLRASKAHGAIAGAVAGTLAILNESQQNRVGYAQQLFMRSMQAGHNALHSRELVRLPQHADAVLFAVACASIMYAFVMHPKTIPSEYFHFIQRLSRVPKPILEFNKSNLRAWEKLDSGADNSVVSVSSTVISKTLQDVHVGPGVVEAILNYINAHNGTMPTVCCQMIHPSNKICSKYIALLWPKTFWGLYPVHSAINGVPMLLLRTRLFLKNPFQSTKRILIASARSSAFLATFVSLFQSAICTHRFVFGNRRDSKYTYYLAGFVTAIVSIFVEHPSRRAELAMYTLPKGMQSLYLVLLNRGRMVRMHGIDVIAVGVAMGIIMSVYQVEPHHMSTVLYNLLVGLVGKY